LFVAWSPWHITLEKKPFWKIVLKAFATTIVTPPLQDVYLKSLKFYANMLHCYLAPSFNYKVELIKDKCIENAP